MDKQKKRGGFRENAGRKVGDDGGNSPRTVTINEETVAILKSFGDGNLSQGIRMAAMMIKNNDPNLDLI